MAIKRPPTRTLRSPRPGDRRIRLSAAARAPGRQGQHRLIREAAQLLIGRIDRVAAAMLAAYCREIPFYRSITNPARRGEIRAAAREHATLILERIAAGVPLTQEDLRRLGELGKIRFEQGFDLDDLTAAYRVGADVVEELLLAELKKLCTPAGYKAAKREVRTQILGYSTKALNAVSRAYRECESEAEPSTARGDTFLGQFLAGTTESASLPQLRLDARQAAVVVDVDAPAELRGRGLDRAEQQKVRSALKRLTPAVAVAMHDGRVVALASLVSKVKWNDEIASALEEAFKDWSSSSGRLVVGIGQGLFGTEGIRYSYRQALDVVAVLKGRSEHPAIMTFEVAARYLSLTKGPSVWAEVYERLIAPLAEHDSRNKNDLISALTMYLAEGRNKSAARRRLFMERPTFDRRLEKIETLTGKRLKDPISLQLFEWALLLHKTNSP